MAVTLRNKTYDKLKHITQVVLPALGSLYFGLSTIWNFPAGEEVVGSIALLTTFGGVVLGVSSRNYNMIPANNDLVVVGDFIVDTTPQGKRVVQLSLHEDPVGIVNQQKIVFNVVDTNEEQKNERFWDPSTAE